MEYAKIIYDEYKAELMQEMFQNDEFRNVEVKMHTPWRSELPDIEWEARELEEDCPYILEGAAYGFI